MSQINTNGIATAITFVFHSEAHREEWMIRMGMIKSQGDLLDYREKRETNLMFTIEAELPPKTEEGLLADEDTEDFPEYLRGPDTMERQLLLPFG